VRGPHLAYSPDLVPCDLCLFGHVKHELHGQSLGAPDAVLAAIIAVFEAVLGGTLERMFLNCLQRLEQTIEFNGELVLDSFKYTYTD
jgi:hypothetical protein